MKKLELAFRMFGFFLTIMLYGCLIFLSSALYGQDTTYVYNRSEIPNGLIVRMDSTIHVNDGNIYFSIDGLTELFSTDINQFYKRIPKNSWPDSSRIRVKAWDLSGNSSGWSPFAKVLIYPEPVEPEPGAIVAYEFQGGNIVGNMNNCYAVDRGNYVEMRGYNDGNKRICWIDIPPRVFKKGTYEIITDCTAWCPAAESGSNVKLIVNGTEHVIGVVPELPMLKLTLELDGLTSIRFVTSCMDVQLFGMRIQQVGKVIHTPQFKIEVY